MEKKSFEYFAFISYNHEDEYWAKWVQRKLETYRFPSALRKQNDFLPKKIFPVFRDQTDLSGGELWDKLGKTLDDSAYLIVICSPRSAQSEYVNREVEYFISIGRKDKIIPVIVDGVPFADNTAEECFCDALKNMDDELLGVSVKELGKQKAVLRLISTITQLRFDSLVRRERVRKRRRAAFGALAVVVVSVVAVLSYNLLISPERSVQFATESQSALNNGQIYEAVESGKKGLNSFLLAKQGSEAAMAFRSALAVKELNESNRELHKAFTINKGSRYYTWLGNSSDGLVMYFYDQVFVEEYNSQTGVLIDRYQLEGEKTEKLAEQLGWEMTEHNDYSLVSPSPAKSRFSVGFKNDKLVVSDGAINKTYSKVSKTDFHYSFNNRGNVFAYYNSNDNSVYIENFDTQKYKIYTLDENIIVKDIRLSKNGGMLCLSCTDAEERNKVTQYIIVDLIKLKSVLEYSIDNYSFIEFVFLNKLDGYFLTISNDKIEKYAFTDITPMELEADVQYLGKAISNPKDYNLFQDCKLSIDGKVVHSTKWDYIDKSDIYKGMRTLNYFFDAQTGELLWEYYDYYDTEYDEGKTWAFDENMTLAFTRFGEIIDIRTGKPVYQEEEVKTYEYIALNRDGTLGAVIDSEHEVYLYRINDGKVIREHLFSYDEFAKENSKGLKKYQEESEITYLDVTNQYIVISNSEALFTYNLSDKKVGVQPDGRYLNYCSSEGSKDGLLFMRYYNSSLFIENLETAPQAIYVDKSKAFGGSSWAYSEKTHLFCGGEMAGSQRYSPEYTVYEYKDGKFKKLYSHYLKDEAVVRFSDDGKYLILNVEYDANKNCYSTVLDARTGEVLLEIPEHIISIVNGNIYEARVPYVPTSLPSAKLYSLKELKAIAKKQN